MIAGSDHLSPEAIHLASRAGRFEVQRLRRRPGLDFGGLGQLGGAADQPGRRDRTRRAGTLPALGETVVLDASWSAARHRRLATDTAEAASSPVLAVLCEVAEATAEERIAARTTTLSDATPDIAHRMTEDADPWPEAHPLDTGGTPRESIAPAVACLVPGHRKSPVQRHSGSPVERAAGARVEPSEQLHTDREAG
ncbi:AAA family ATPase [Amycolatopsis sp. NPDC058278]|uniref:AAA family ATPase n=1 Tax=Amycolatopsis sp. NPDC058278 TaxID=3346417 RepID=UPI0036D98CE1